MWNCAHTALLRAIGSEDGLLSVDNLRAIVWLPMYTAADCLLDMLVHLQSDLEKHAEKVRVRLRPRGHKTFIRLWPRGHKTSGSGPGAIRL